MKNIKHMKKVALLAVLALWGHGLPAQLLLLGHRAMDNPSAMGEAAQPCAALYGQHRLYGFEGAPLAAALQVTVPFKVGAAGSAYRGGAGYEDAKSMFVGLTVAGEQAGAQRGYGALLAYAYQLPLGAGARLAFGVALGAAAEAREYGGLLEGYEADPLIARLPGATRYALAAQAGAYLHGAAWYASLYSPAATARDVLAQAGWRTALGGGGEGYYGDGEAASARRWEVHAQAGVARGALAAQASTLFTLNRLLGVGVAWEHPLNLAALATLRFGAVHVGYSYQLYGLQPTLMQHELAIKITFARGEEE